MRGEESGENVIFLFVIALFFKRAPLWDPSGQVCKMAGWPDQAGRECRVGISASRQPIPVRPIIKAMGKGVPS